MLAIMWGTTEVSRPTFQAPEELSNIIRQIAAPKAVRAGEVLFRRGDPVQGVYLVESGQVQLSVGGGGATWIAEVGSMLGLPATVRDSDYSLTAVAIEDTAVAFADKALVRKVLAENVALCFHVVQILSGELQWLRETVVIGE
jgi:CRP-like cAMP-binding protein